MHFNHKLENAGDNIYIRDDIFKSDPAEFIDSDFELAAKDSDENIDPIADSVTAKAVNDSVTELAVLSDQDSAVFNGHESAQLNDLDSDVFNDHESAVFNDYDSAVSNDHNSAVFNDHESGVFNDHDSINDQDRTTRTKRDISEHNAISRETIKETLEPTSAESEFNLSKMELFLPTFLFGVNSIMFIGLLRPVLQFIWNIINQLFLGIFTLLG